MTDEIVKELIRNSLRQLVRNDNFLISIRVKEEAINHRFAVYVEQEFNQMFPNQDNISFDLEYNRSYFDEKELIDDNDERVRFRPDLIIHERNSNVNNKIAFELKKGYANRKDKRTMIGVLHPPFSYCRSVFISYLPDRDYFRITIFEHNSSESYILSKVDLANE